LRTVQHHLKKTSWNSWILSIYNSKAQ
jgi:hypothetical protein